MPARHSPPCSLPNPSAPRTSAALAGLRRRALALALLALPVLSPETGRGADWPQWRGPNRDGVSPETGLLAEWPEGGPKLAWKVSDLGSGYSTPVVVGDRIYVLSNDGVERESVVALDARNGAKVWSVRLGAVGQPKQNPNFPGARSTPTVRGDVLVALGSDGDLACLETATGKVRWWKQLRTEFGGKMGTWAYAESPLIDGDTVVCTPGGAEATVLALNLATGDVLWKSALPQADEAGYASAQVVETGGVRQYVQLLQKGLVGVEARSGRPLWRHDKAVSRYGANIPTPVVGGDLVYFGSAGTGGGAVRLVARDGGVTAEPQYFEAKLPTAIGGSVKVGEDLYGTTGQALLCVEFATGRIRWEDRGIGTASICLADGRLYLHGENGDVALVEPNRDGYRQKGRFTPPDQPRRSAPMEKSWTHPVVAQGRLFLRDHAMLWAYEVRR